MDESQSYLHAIQKIPDETPKGKWKSIDNTVQEIIRGIKDDDYGTAIASHNLPIPLIPTFNLLLGIKLKKPEAVVDALKSEDSDLVILTNRATWFYDGSYPEITSFEYFSNKILPFTSMQTRRFVIKQLSRKLIGKPILGEEFFNGFVKLCGPLDAVSLLKVCREDFIYDSVVKYKIKLKDSLIRFFYRTCPNLVLRYLRIGLKTEQKDADNFKVNIEEYFAFLPALIPNHINEFHEFHPKAQSHSVLGNRRATLFLKKSPSILINNPKEYLHLMDFKVVLENLSSDQFETMIVNLFPENVAEFYADQFLTYLKSYTKDKLASFLVTKFREKYNSELYDTLSKMTPALMLVLPDKDRIMQAKKLLEDDPEWDLYSYKKSWWCYLSCEESIPAIKTQITKQKTPSNRRYLMKQLIYNCKVNESKKDLLSVLRYIYDKHKNEQSFIIFDEFLYFTDQQFNLATLSADHWEIINNFINRAYLKKEIVYHNWRDLQIIKKHVEFCLKNNLPHEKSLNMLLEIHLTAPMVDCSFVENDSPEYHRLYLEALLAAACEKYPITDTKYWLQMSFLCNLVSAVYDFNEKHAKPGTTIKKMSLRDYPWMITLIKIAGKELLKLEDYDLMCLKKKVKKHEPELLEELFPGNIEDELTFHKAHANLKKDHKEVLNNWNEYFKFCTEYKVPNSFSRRKLRFFLRQLRWYQNIPLKILERAMADVAKNDYPHYLFHIIGELTDGYTYTKFVEPLLPINLILDPEEIKDSSQKYMTVMNVIKAGEFVNPPVPFSLLEICCKNDFANQIMSSLMNIAQRTSVGKSLDFAKSLIEQRVSIKKHGIRLLYLLGSRNDVLSCLSRLWVTEKQTSIRELTASKILSYFQAKPCAESWALMAKCMEEISEDEDHIVEVLMTFDKVPDDYIVDYILKMYAVINKLSTKKIMPPNIKKLIRELLDKISPKYGHRLPEDFCQEIIKKYLFHANEEDLTISSSRFMFYVYFEADETFDDRLALFTAFLKSVLQDWDKPQAETKYRYPVRRSFQQFVNFLMKEVGLGKGKKRVIEAIFITCFSVIPPQKDPRSYFMLFFCSECPNVTSPTNFGSAIGNNMEKFISSFSLEYILGRFPDLLQLFLCYCIDAHLVEVPMMEGLLKTNNIYAQIIVGKMMLYHVEIYDKKYDPILNELRKVKHLAVKNIVQEFDNEMKVTNKR